MTRWIWIAFSDDDAPKGDRARGALIVAADATEDAVSRAAILALSNCQRAMEFSDYTYHWAEMDPVHGDPHPTWVDHPLDNAEAARVATQWTGGVASDTQIRDAFADDTATTGDPLFRPQILARLRGPTGGGQ